MNFGIWGSGWTATQLGAICPLFPLTWSTAPQPPKPREWWVNYENDLVLEYIPDEDGSFKSAGYVHVREVLE